MEKQVDSTPGVVYLPKHLYHLGENGFPEEFSCIACGGVVLDPQECESCQTLYCKHCILHPTMPCLKKCQTPTYGKANRIIVAQLSKLKFRCLQYHYGCQEVSTHADYGAHQSVCLVA